VKIKCYLALLFLIIILLNLKKFTHIILDKMALADIFSCSLALKLEERDFTIHA